MTTRSCKGRSFIGFSPVIQLLDFSTKFLTGTDLLALGQSEC
jgi:hypothetical protein